MNKDSFLTCLSYTGINTGVSVLGLYSLASGNSILSYNQLYTTGYNIYSGVPYSTALPLVFNGTGAQTSGIFSTSQPYQIGASYTGDFGLLIAINYSGCLNNGNINYLLASTVTGNQNNNSGAILGITPSNRLFFNVSGYSYTIPKEIDIGDLAFFSVEKNRLVNVGLFSLKDDYWYEKSYDFGSSGIAVKNLYIGGAINYSSNFTGYSGRMDDVYLFNSNVKDEYLKSCADCSFATGYSYIISSSGYSGVQVTGSYWTGIQQITLTGYQKTSGNYRKSDGTSGYYYYDSGLSGNVTAYQSLIPQLSGVLYTISGSGLTFSYDTNKKISGSYFDVYFDLGLGSGDIVEFYTYPNFNYNLNLSVQSSLYPLYAGTQIFSNGLAETKDVDFKVLFNNTLSGFDNSDYLKYDVYSGTYTMPYTTGYIKTGVSTTGYVLITGVSGLSISSSFGYDLYLNGQKMASGINYSYTPGNLTVSGNDFQDINNASGADLEIKFIPIYSGFIRNLYQITQNQYYISGISGFSEQIWVNGLRQTKDMDYFKYNRCRFCSGDYYDPNYSFTLYNSFNDSVNLFTTGSLAQVVYTPDLPATGTVPIA